VSPDLDAAAGTVIEALSDPTRRKIVTLLSDGPKRAGELAAEVGMSAPAISRHLRVLLSALVIADERLTEDARARVFRLRPQSIKTVQAWLDQLTAGRAVPDAIADGRAAGRGA
jgi:DNA-binding transcriptional ArsR family regulator